MALAPHYWMTSYRLPRLAEYLANRAAQGNEAARLLWIDLARCRTQKDMLEEVDCIGHRSIPVQPNDRGGVAGSSITQRLKVLLAWAEREPSADADSTAYRVYGRDVATPARTSRDAGRLTTAPIRADTGGWTRAAVLLILASDP